MFHLDVKTECTIHTLIRTIGRASSTDRAKDLETRVYQVTKLASSPEERDLVIAMTSKSSAQRLIAAFAEAQGPDRYRVTCFEHPTLPGMEH